MRRLLLLVILFFNLGVLPSYASGNVIIDRLTTQDAEDLNIVIPYDVPPGFHSITIEVYDDAGTVNEKEIPFCKNLNGEILPRSQRKAMGSPSQHLQHLPSCHRRHSRGLEVVKVRNPIK